MVRTLEDWSDQERQVRYKQSVPFVHVPRELLAQWDQYSRLMKVRQAWFIESLTDGELAAMATFDTEVAAFDFEVHLPDVPEVFDLPQWRQLMDKGRELLSVLKP